MFEYVRGNTWECKDLPSCGCETMTVVCYLCFAATNVETLMTENAKVLKLIRSEILQTEVRVLYELLYNRNNSFRSNRTLKALKQVRAAVKAFRANFTFCFDEV